MWETDFLKKHHLFFDENLSNLEDPLLHTQALLIEDVNFRVFSEPEYIDSAYRVDYKPVNIKPQILAAQYYIQHILPLLQHRKDKVNLHNALSSYHETLINHYSSQDKEILYTNTKEISRFNTMMYKLGLANNSTYWKMRIFIVLINLKIFENKIFVLLIKKMGFTNFYLFNIEKLLK